MVSDAPCVVEEVMTGVLFVSSGEAVVCALEELDECDDEGISGMKV